MKASVEERDESHPLSRSEDLGESPEILSSYTSFSSAPSSSEENPAAAEGLRVGAPGTRCHLGSSNQTLDLHWVVVYVKDQEGGF